MFRPRVLAYLFAIPKELIIFTKRINYRYMTPSFSHLPKKMS